MQFAPSVRQQQNSPTVEDLPLLERPPLRSVLPDIIPKVDRKYLWCGPNATCAVLLHFLGPFLCLLSLSITLRIVWPLILGPA